MTEFTIPASVSAEQAQKVWNELLDCLDDANGFGGDVCEIYLYTVLPWSPRIQATHAVPHLARPGCSPICVECDAREVYQKGCRAIHAIARSFEAHNVCRVEFEGGESIDFLLDEEPFHHRIHLRVTR